MYFVTLVTWTVWKEKWDKSRFLLVVDKKNLRDENCHEILSGRCKIYKKIVNPVKNTSQNIYYDNDNYEEDYEEDVSKDEEYEAGLALWKSYGLTKQQFDADLQHRKNIAALDAFNQDPENYLAPQYREMLELRIKKFEDEMAAKEKAEEEALQDINWYNPDHFDLDDPFEDWSFPLEETLEDFAERMREDRFESAIENARDDMRDY